MGYRTTKSKIKVESHKANTYTDFYYHFFRNILLVSVPLVIISAIILSSLHSSAATGSNSGTDNLTISISSACTLGSVVDIEHNTNTSVGTYTPNIGKTTITTLCNDGNGYSVYANGFSNNEEGNNKLINSAYPQYSIDTGLATSGLTSTWAMKLNNMPDDPSPTPPTIESDYNNTYGIIPSYWTKVASRASGTTDMAQGSSFTTTYAVYASSSQYAGTYNGQVKYLLTHPYINNAHFMQGVAAWKNDLAEGGSVQAIDTRDNKTYWVTKLSDGNVWMTQNLDFDIGANSILNSVDTDLNNIYDPATGDYAAYNNGYVKNDNIIYWEPADTATTFNFSNDDGLVVGWQSSYTEPYSASKIDSRAGHESLGNYYNWTAAVASNSSSSFNVGGKTANNSICPKGWRLPNPNELAKLNQLYNNSLTNTDAGLIAYPLYFVKAGSITQDMITGVNSQGVYLSNMVNSAIGCKGMDFNSTSVRPNEYFNNDYGGKSGGFTIRCIAR